MRLLLTLLVAAPLLAYGSDGERWWVFFTDKPSAASQPPAVSGRALERKAQAGLREDGPNLMDRPVEPAYVEAVRASGARVQIISRWLNAVSVEADEQALRTLRDLPFVRGIQPVRQARRSPERLEPQFQPALRKTSRTTGISYGQSFTQNSTLNALPLHDLGVIGRGVLVGMIDDGFNSYRTHAALRSVNVLAAYDFVQGDTTVSVDPGEYPTQGFHGAATMSVLAGYDPGFLIGPAFGATLALAKTEVDSVEIIAEEDHYVRGIEWLDSVGVRIISSSLGYIDWYTQAQLNGQTAITTQIARTLAARGILLVTAMGNEGNYRPGTQTSGTLIAPADADSILSVGAVGPGGMLTGFSSTGPTADDRTKPEVVAQGSSMQVAVWTSPNAYNSLGQGTSYATPMAAAAAALILSAHPDATPMQVRAAMMNTAVPYDEGTARTSAYPNNFYGWGRVDAYAAALSLGPVVSNIPIVQYAVVANEPSLVVTIRAASSSLLDMSRFAIYARRTTDSTFTRYPFSAGGTTGLFTARIPVSDASDTAYVGYVTFADQGGPEHRRPLGTALFELHPTPDSISSLFPPSDGDPIPGTFVLRQNYPNPFNAGTTVIFQAPRREHVDLTVFNLLGQKVRTLFSGTATPGSNIVTWTRATDDAGRDLPSGVYLLRLTTSSEGQLLGKMVLLK